MWQTTEHTTTVNVMYVATTENSRGNINTFFIQINTQEVDL